MIWLVLAGRLWQIQVLRGPYYSQIAEQNYLRSLDIPAPRGKIYDRHGALILGNRPFYDLVVVPQFLGDITHTFNHLARVLKVSPEYLHRSYDLYKNAPDFAAIPLKKNLTLHEVALVEQARSQLSGIDIATDVRRDYSTSPPPHVVGYLASPTPEQYAHLKEHYPDKSYRSSDLVGKYGLEQVWESHLRGRRGRRWIRVDALGRRVVSPSVPTTKGSWEHDATALPHQKAQPGHHLALTLDFELQKIAEDAFAGKNGAVVVLDATDGGILALITTPRYPADLYQSQIPQHRWQNLIKDPMHPLFDKTTGAEFQPGSIFKIVVALAGLQEALVTPQTQVNCPGYHVFAGRTFHCHKKEGHGPVNLAEAIIRSCNVYFYHLAQSLGINGIARYAEMFHLGRKLGLNLNYERSGLVPTPQWKKRVRGQPWFDGETSLVGIGQGSLLTTPLQLASLMVSVGTWGKLWQPYLVKRIVDRAGEVVESVGPRLISHITDIERRHFDSVREGLKGAVYGEGATAWRAQVEGLTVAGKTGSVQVVGMQRQLDKEGLFDVAEMARERREHALFAAYAPAHQPEIALAIVSQHDDFGGGGAQAAPVAQKIMAGYWQLRQKRLLAQRPSPQ